ncbi:MAG: hydroxyacid dehydrogenase [Firmicutes bacterium]|nr:hydroxyacid dehydrogenase [Candidatus Colimorpha enterica]
MKILVTGAWHNAADNIGKLEEMGFTVYFLQFEKDNLPDGAEDADAIICHNLFAHHPIEQFGNLKYIQVTSAGTEHLPLDYIEKHGIKLNNARGVYSVPMAEYAVSGVLDLCKHRRYFDGNQKAHRWEKDRDLLELYGKTVTILGCGSVGQECAKRFSAFGCRIIGIDNYKKSAEYFDEIYPTGRLAEVLPSSFVTVISLPLTDETEGLFDEKTFSYIPDGSILVNISRGKIVKTDALIKNADRLLGAVIDVFEEEPLDPLSPLWDKENVIVTPHNSFVGDGNDGRLTSLIFSNLENIN